MVGVLNLIAVILTCICSVMLVIMIDIHKIARSLRDKAPTEKEGAAETDAARSRE